CSSSNRLTGRDVALPVLVSRGPAASRVCFWEAIMTEPKPRHRVGQRAKLVRRIWRTAEAQVREIERRLIDQPPPPEERERNARTLAVLARTLRDLDALDCDNSGRPTQDDDTVPRDVEALRRELSRKIDEIIAERETDLARAAE